MMICRSDRCRGHHFTNNLEHDMAINIRAAEKLVSKRKTCEFIEVSALVPAHWRSWFWGTISEDAPFSWGDNNRSLVTACDFRRHCDDRLLDAAANHGARQEDIDQFLNLLKYLGEIYLDLEN